MGEAGSRNNQVIVRKRGRPRMNGVQPVWMWARVIIVLDAFNEARNNGEKYEAAILAAVNAFKEQYPGLRMGPRRVKQILAEWQPAGSPMALVVTKCSDAKLQSPEMQRQLELYRSWGVPLGKRVAVYTMGIGPRPEYPRINAMQSRTTSDSSR